MVDNECIDDRQDTEEGCVEIVVKLLFVRPQSGKKENADGKHNLLYDILLEEAGCKGKITGAKKVSRSRK